MSPDSRGTPASQSLEDIIIERILGREKVYKTLLFVGLKNNICIYSLKRQYCKNENAHWLSF